MTLLVHPFGNEFVRALLSALDGAGLLAKFVTALGWSDASPLLHELPAKLRSQMARRGYDLPHSKIRIHPAREIGRASIASGAASISLRPLLYANLINGRKFARFTRTKTARNNYSKRRANSACAAFTICPLPTGKPCNVFCKKRQSGIRSGSPRSSPRAIPMKSWRARHVNWNSPSW